MEKKVSIIIPVYNCEKYIGKCLQSVVDQTYKNTEVIVIDDGSTDKSPQICDFYAEKYPNLKVIHQSNKGLGATRNVGVDHSTGDYITYVDSDDYISRYCIEKTVEIAEKYHVDMVEFGKVFMLASKNIFINCDQNIEYLDTVDKICEKRRTMRDTAWGRLYTRELVSKVRFPEIRLYEDVAYARDVFKHCHSMVKYNYALYAYRAYQESLTRGKASLKTIKIKIREYENNYSKLETEEEKNNLTKDFLVYCKKMTEDIRYRSEQIISSKQLEQIYLFLETIRQQDTYNDKDELNAVIDVVYKAIQDSHASLMKYCYKQLRNLYSRCMGSFKTWINYEYKI